MPAPSRGALGTRSCSRCLVFSMTLCIDSSKRGTGSSRSVLLCTPPRPESTVARLAGPAISATMDLHGSPT